MPFALVLVGERFGVPPWELEQAPSDRVRYYMNLLGIEGDARGAMDGLSPDEEFYRED